MSYLVLARKWRPQTFAEVIGQDHVTLTLRKAVEKGRLAHAYLFTGPRGCGKTTTARLLAKVINCESPVGSEPCNSCASCLAVAEGRHLDVFEIDGASNRGIDEIRDLREKIGYAASRGGSKIYIIDEVHMLTPQAFNALLKTLEEPPSHVYLIFATTEPHKVPATILSRCQRFNFKRLEIGEIVEQLEKICGIEKIEYGKEALMLIARRAEGSMRDAESLLDQCISATEAGIDLDLVRKVLGLVDSQLIVKILRAIGDHDRALALSVVDSVVSGGLDLEKFFLAYIEGIRNLLVLQVEGVDWLDLTSDEIEEMRDICSRFTMEDLLYLFRQASRSFREFKLSSQPRYFLEAAVAEAASWESAVELSALIDRIDSGGAASPGTAAPSRSRPGKGGGSAETGHGEPAPEDRGGGGGKDRASASAAESRSKDGTAYAKIDRSPEPKGEREERPGRAEDAEEWERFLSKIRETKLTLGIWLVSAEYRGVKGNNLLLRFNYQNRFAREMVLEEKNKRYIEAQLEKFYGKKLVIETVETDGGGGDGTREVEAPPPRDDLLEGAPPMVREIAKTFDGELRRKQ
ncbi:MAG TPA: DNA polymerase III subunit gamma/tau [Candidatus Eisenbacteria bacterium]|uniref:DNA polymerase III subunit gamma/tau n=1 Tax=Eiseniibacteriota bacterium TaxID=2212470 RepID=A0A7V2AUB7_UNCEI|nr:DNA polymerase III subunit gamma/tau [Candidatus Eisenbacteria bacterium]